LGVVCNGLEGGSHDHMEEIHNEVDRERAKRWFRDQFGVTFTEETRPMTVYVVRRAADRR